MIVLALLSLLFNVATLVMNVALSPQWIPISVVGIALSAVWLGQAIADE